MAIPGRTEAVAPESGAEDFRPPGGRKDEAGGERLLFRLGEELFSFPVSSVREIVDVRGITHVPESPPFMIGVINLRGRVVPVVDLRLKFGLPPGERTPDTRVLVAEAQFPGEQVILGVLVDGVVAVDDIRGQDLAPPPELGAGVREDFIEGVGSHKEGFVIFLHLDKVLAYEELTGAATA
jgi:purine-binding chemotaxis protein CheW